MIPRAGLRCTWLQSASSSAARRRASSARASSRASSARLRSSTAWSSAACRAARRVRRSRSAASRAAASSCARAAVSSDSRSRFALAPRLRWDGRGELDVQVAEARRLALAQQPSRQHLVADRLVGGRCVQRRADPLERRLAGLAPAGEQAAGDLDEPPHRLALGLAGRPQIRRRAAALEQRALGRAQPVGRLRERRDVLRPAADELVDRPRRDARLAQRRDALRGLPVALAAQALGHGCALGHEVLEGQAVDRVGVGRQVVVGHATNFARRRMDRQTTGGRSRPSTAAFCLPSLSAAERRGELSGDAEATHSMYRRVRSACSFSGRRRLGPFPGLDDGVVRPGDACGGRDRHSGRTCRTREHDQHGDSWSPQHDDPSCGDVLSACSRRA